MNKIEFKLKYYPNNKKEAKELGSLYFFNGKPCRNGHYSLRYTNGRGACQQCRKERGARNHTSRKETDPEYSIKRQKYSIQYYQKNAENIRSKRRQYYRNNLEYSKESHRKWAERNREHLTAYMKQFRKNYPEKSKEAKKKYALKNKEFIRRLQRDYKKKNRAYFNAKWAERNALKLQAIPTWDKGNKATSEHYESLYRLARNFSEFHEIPFHVDHIVPLKGKKIINGSQVHVVCGLHTPSNLRIITAEDNLAKSCFSWPDM